ncbi:MAG: hypothetical protein K0M40_22530 [Prolixibacteraceae bacterium]|nr:hypothetical protein [Prolixibacteraceae bacterium]
MQKKFIDHEDYDHLISSLSGDFRPLINKIKRLEKHAELTKNGLNKKDLWDKCVEWINPTSQNKWIIHYGYIRYGKKTKTHFYPYTEFNTTKGEKAYLLISKEYQHGFNSAHLTKSAGIKFSKNSEQYFGDFLLKDHWTISVFRGHFFFSFRDTVQNNDLTPFQIIHEFAGNKKYRLVENFVQNEKWFLYLQSNGVAMIKQCSNYLLFDTYISIDELKDDQLDAIKNHLKQLDENDYFPTAINLMEGPGWRKYIDIERIIAFVNKVKSKNPELGNKLEAEITGYWKKYYP